MTTHLFRWSAHSNGIHINGRHNKSPFRFNRARFNSLESICLEFIWRNQIISIEYTFLKHTEKIQFHETLIASILLCWTNCFFFVCVLAIRTNFETVARWSEHVSNKRIMKRKERWKYKIKKYDFVINQILMKP